MKKKLSKNTNFTDNSDQEDELFLNSLCNVNESNNQSPPMFLK